MHTETTPAVAPDARPWLTAGFLMLGTFMNILDTTIVNLALPAIRADLGAGPSALQWVLVVYVLTFGACLLPFGRFGDIFGRKRLFVLGLLGFVATSLAAGATPNVGLLIAARALQGFAAAAMAPQVLAIIHGLFQEDERGKAIGLFGMVTALGAVAGPVIGGAILSADLFELGWRSIFLINLPLGLIALLGALATLPGHDDPPVHGKADWIGSGLLALALAALIYPMIEGRSLGWPLWLLILPGLSAGLALAFLRRQKRLERRGRLQTLPPALLRQGSYVAGVGMVMVVISGMAGTMVVLSIFLQSGLRLSPAEAGLAIAPHPISAMVASLASSRLGSRRLPLRIFAGLLVLFAGLFWLRLASGNGTTWGDFVGPLLLIGGGSGTAIVALFQFTLSQVSGPDAGAGTGGMQAFQQIGIALGIAIIGQLFFGCLGVADDPASYRSAMGAALLYPVIGFGILSLIALGNLQIGKDKHET